MSTERGTTRPTTRKSTEREDYWPDDEVYELSRELDDPDYVAHLMAEWRELCGEETDAQWLDDQLYPKTDCMGDPVQWA